MTERDALKKRITEWLFSPKWTGTHTEFDEVEAIADFVESEVRYPRCPKCGSYRLRCAHGHAWEIPAHAVIDLEAEQEAARREAAK